MKTFMEIGCYTVGKHFVGQIQLPALPTRTYNLNRSWLTFCLSTETFISISVIFNHMQFFK
jgi:hypothetical protein